MNCVSGFTNWLRMSRCLVVLVVESDREGSVVACGKGTGGVVKELTDIGVEG